MHNKTTLTYFKTTLAASETKDNIIVTYQPSLYAYG